VGESDYGLGNPVDRSAPARADVVKFDVLVAQKEAIRLDFADNSKHFFLLVRREGKSEGQGELMGSRNYSTMACGRWLAVPASSQNSKAPERFILCPCRPTDRRFVHEGELIQ
jgi:hypothetical protein